MPHDSPGTLDFCSAKDLDEIQTAMVEWTWLTASRGSISVETCITWHCRCLFAMDNLAAESDCNDEILKDEWTYFHWRIFTRQQRWSQWAVPSFSRRLLPTLAVDDAWVGWLYVWVTVCLCKSSKMKMAWAISTPDVVHISLWQDFDINWTWGQKVKGESSSSPGYYIRRRLLQFLAAACSVGGHTISSGQMQLSKSAGS